MRVLYALPIALSALAQSPDYGNIPLHFEPNRGQNAPHIRYVANASTHPLYILDDGFTLGTADLRMRLLRSNRPSHISPEDPLPGVSHYLADADPSRWRRNVPHYRRVELNSIYPGIDIAYYGSGRHIEYDFLIAAGGDPARIVFTFEGMSAPRLEPETGDLLFETKEGELRQHKPIAYQLLDGRRQSVAAAYRVTQNRISFQLAKYDTTRPLIIDPTLTYSSLFGLPAAIAVAVDAAGSAYVLAGNTISKLDPQGTAFVYSTTLSHGVSALAVDPGGSAYVCGFSRGGAPVKNALQPVLGGGEYDVFLSRLNTNGDDFVFATYLGGSGNEVCSKVRIDGTGAIYVTGITNSANFPTTNPAQPGRSGEYDIYLTKLTPNAASIAFSTYYGGGANDQSLGLWIDSLGNSIVSGTTDSTNFPLVNPKFTSPSRNILLKFSPTGQTLFATYLAAYGDFVVADAQNNIYTAGYSIPAVLGLPAGGAIARMKPDGSDFALHAFLGNTYFRDFTIDPAGNLYATGNADSTLATVRSMQSFSGSDDVFVAKVAPTGTILYSTYLGSTGQEVGYGIASDASGAAYVAGYNNSPGFPTTGAMNSGYAFAAKIVDSPDNRIVTVNFGATSPLINPGLEVILDGVRLTAPASVRWLSGTTHTISTFAAQGGSGLRYQFLNWSDGGLLTHTITVPNTTSDLNLTVTFSAQIQLITAVFPANGGTVNVTPASADGYYPLNSTVTLTAVPAASFFFLGWTGSATGTTNPRSYTLSYSLAAPVNSVIANFTQSGPPPPTLVSLGFVPTTPCRLVDTRPGEGRSGNFGPPFLTGGSSRDIPVPQGVCNIPNTAKAYSLNVTVVPIRPLSYLTLHPTGTNRPGVSTLNAFEGQIIANAAIVPAGVNGSITAFVTDDTQVIIDINGYFTDSTGAESLSFYRLAPCRIIDTRAGTGGPTGAFGPPSFSANSTRSFSLPAGSCGIPSTAKAYVTNVTVVPGGQLDYITTWPTGSAQPFVSTLNSPQGRVLANAAIVPAGSNGAISFYAPQATDVIVDISGYFAPSGQVNAQRFYTVAPCRLSDTRSSDPPLIAGQTVRNYTVYNHCDVPLVATAYSLNATVVPSGYLGFLTLYPGDATRPLVSTLNAWNGQVAANAAIVPAAGGGISAFASNDTHLIIDVNGYFAP